MQSIMLVLMLPLLVLNLLAGVIGGIWLGLLGEWAILLGGAAYLFGGVFLIGVALMPGILFSVPAAKAAEDGKVLQSILFGLPAVVWTYAVVAATCILVFGRIVENIDWENRWPLVLWGYAVVTAPWSFLARKDAETGNDNSSGTVFFAQLGTVAMMAVTVIEDRFVGLDALAVWFLPFICVGLLFHLAATVELALRR